MTAKAKAKENEICFVGGHHDGETMVIDPKQDKIELDWVEVRDQIDHRGDAFGDIAVDPDGLVYPVKNEFHNGGSKTGKETYYRNPDDPAEFIIDDGKDYRLAMYKLGELRVETEELVDRLCFAGNSVFRLTAEIETALLQPAAFLVAMGHSDRKFP